MEPTTLSPKQQVLAKFPQATSQKTFDKYGQITGYEILPTLTNHVALGHGKTPTLAWRHASWRTSVLPPVSGGSPEAEPAAPAPAPAGGQHATPSTIAPTTLAMLDEAQSIYELSIVEDRERAGALAALQSWLRLRTAGEIEAMSVYLADCFGWAKASDDPRMLERPLSAFIASGRAGRPMPATERRRLVSEAWNRKVAELAAAKRVQVVADAVPPVVEVVAVESAAVVTAIETGLEWHRIVARSLGSRAAREATEDQWATFPAPVQVALATHIDALGYRAFPPLTEQAAAWRQFLVACDEGVGIVDEATLDRYEQGLASAEWRDRHAVDDEIPVLEDAERVTLEVMGDDVVDELARGMGLMPIRGGAPDMLPCPFCGSEAFLDEHNGTTISGHYSSRVECDSCGGDVRSETGWGKDRSAANETAIKNWNTRVPVEPFRPNAPQAIPIELVLPLTGLIEEALARPLDDDGNWRDRIDREEERARYRAAYEQLRVVLD